MGTLQAVNVPWLFGRHRWLVGHLKVSRFSFDCLPLLQQLLNLAKLLGHFVFGLLLFLFSFLEKFYLFLNLFSCATMSDPCVRVCQKSLKILHLLDACVVSRECDIVSYAAADGTDKTNKRQYFHNVVLVLL